MRLIILLALLTGCGSMIAPGAPRPICLEDGGCTKATTPDGWYLGRDGFWQRSIYVANVTIKSR